MKRTIAIFLTVGVSLAFWGCSQDPFLGPTSGDDIQAASAFKAAEAKPAPNLVGEMALDRNPNYVFNEANPYIEPAWQGKITFEDGSVYDMKFFHLSPKKGYSQASPFVERFKIYDSSGTVVLEGPDEGATIMSNKPSTGPYMYHMNGMIDAASAPFTEWLGRSVHMQGTIMTDPDGSRHAPGTFRIN